jgi:outer membrane lipoprotein-sorting protein
MKGLTHKVLVTPLIIVAFLMTGPQALGIPKIKSLRGTMVVSYEEGEKGIAFKVWAKGNNMRTELSVPPRTVITLQRGNFLYIYEEGSKVGKKESLGVGLASVGLVKQIEEVKTYGKKQGSKDIDGDLYYEYLYTKVDGEGAWVLLSAGTSIPKYWVSQIETPNGEVSVMKMIFRDMAANIHIPDSMFELPKGVTFKE